MALGWVVMRTTSTEKNTTNPERTHHDERKRSSAPTKSGFVRRYRGWWIGVMILLPLLLPTIVVVGDRGGVKTNNNNNINNNSNSYDYRSRQLLEHGLRGGTEGPSAKEASDRPGVSTTFPTALASNATIPLHAHSGTWHVHLYIGSPPQRQTLIVDTGSKAMAFPCKTCPACGECCGVHASPYFDPSVSTTHRVPRCGDCLLEGISKCSRHQFFGLGSGSNSDPNPNSNLDMDAHAHANADSNADAHAHADSSDEGSFCTFSQKYTEGSSWTATEVEDVVWFGSENVEESIERFLPQLAVAYPFGCQTNSKGLFRKQYADGILGLSIHDTSIVTFLHNDGLIPRNAFSLCFTHEGGTLTLGGTLDPRRYHLRPMVATPVTRQHEHGYYSVEVVRVLVGGTGHKDKNNNNNNVEATIITDQNTRPRLLRDMNSGRGCILDSGTTDSYFPSSLASVVRRAVTEYASSNSNYNNNNNNNIDDDRYPPYDPEDLDLFSNQWRHREYTYSEFERLLPVVTVILANDASLDILPQHYMEQVPIDPQTGGVVPWEGYRELTNRLYFEEPEGSVLGANAFFGYDMLFDSGRQRVGIAPADCHGAAAGALRAKAAR